MLALFSSLFFLIVALICLAIYVGLYVCVAKMAQDRRRNPVLWLILSFLGTPLLMCIILYCIGDATGDGTWQ